MHASVWERMGRSLGEGDVLMDISVGQQLLREIMVRYDHKNLDELDAGTQRDRQRSVGLRGVGAWRSTGGR